VSEDEATRARVAAELARVREDVRSRVPAERPPDTVLPAPRAVRAPEAMPVEAELPAPPLPPRPDNAALNTSWDLARLPLPAGVRGRLIHAVRALLQPVLDAQTIFNSRQVQFDNELLAWTEGRLDATHRQYDAVLGIHRRHMAEIDERHLIVQEELVAHVHDLVRRIDLVLGESERGRVSLENALKDVRARLQALEQRCATDHGIHSREATGGGPSREGRDAAPPPEDR
jgi:hypothetical protein